MDTIESVTTSKDSFKKVVSLWQMDDFKAVQFVPSKQMALKWSNNEQERPWTTLKPLAFPCGFQNGPAGFKIVCPTLKSSDGFEAGGISN